MSGDHNMKLIASLAQVNDFVMVHGNELQAILDYVEDMEQRISIVREQLQYLVAESVEPDEELKPLCDENHIMFGAYTVDFIQAIEAKLKEKNT